MAGAKKRADGRHCAQIYLGRDEVREVGNVMAEYEKLVRDELARNGDFCARA